MNNSNLRIAAYSLAIASTMIFGAGTALAADVSTKCVTATTEAMHAKASAQMEKDIAPYANATGATAAVVKQYKNELEAGWAAMLEPYCGYAGIASAIHSYDKTVTRTRAAFLLDIKHPDVAVIKSTTAIPVDATTTSSVSSVKAAASTPTVSGTVKKKAVVSTTSSASFSGLHQGMRSASVTALQKKLAAYLGLSTDDYVTGYFGAKTQANIIAFQLKKGIISSKNSSAAGLIGPKTTAALGAL